MDTLIVYSTHATVMKLF